MKWWPVKSDTENPAYISIQLRQNVIDGKVLFSSYRTYSEQQILENFSSIGQILLKICFLKGKNNSLWENEVYEKPNAMKNQTSILS